MKHKYLLAVPLLLIAAGIYGGGRYYFRAVLPEKRLLSAYETQTALFESIRPESMPANTEAHELLAPAEKVNSEPVGWLRIEGTHIDYQVAQAGDNDFYLHNGFDRQYNYELGCPFLDYRCEPDFSGFNSIVYAHNMDRQRMFADLVLYQDAAFMEANPCGLLTTDDGTHSVRFFAYLTVPSNAAAYHAVFVTDNEKAEYLDYLFAEAQYTAGYTADDLKSRDHLRLLLLSTCTFEYDEARGILAGVIEE